MFWNKRQNNNGNKASVDTYMEIQEMIRYLDFGHWPGNLFYPLISETDSNIIKYSAKIQGAIIRKNRTELFEEIIYLKYGKKLPNINRFIQKDGDEYLIKIFNECCSGVKGLRREWKRFLSNSFDFPQNEFLLTEEEYKKYFK
jgi:hypothetical protein